MLSVGSMFLFSVDIKPPVDHNMLRKFAIDFQHSSTYIIFLQQKLFCNSDYFPNNMSEVYYIGRQGLNAKITLNGIMQVPGNTDNPNVLNAKVTRE